MKVNFKRAFLKDLDNLPENIKRQIQETVFLEIPKTKSLMEIKGVKKLRGYSNYYRIKFNDYRVDLNYVERKL